MFRVSQLRLGSYNALKMKRTCSISAYVVDAAIVAAVVNLNLVKITELQSLPTGNFTFFLFFFI